MGPAVLLSCRPAVLLSCCAAGPAVLRGAGGPIWVPVAERASVTGWKKVVPPEEQLPLPPEVRPTALPPEKSEPPLSPGSAQTSVWIRPLTMSPLP
ncbi:hypothetical protein SHIRM173S_11639 [Streptomyces hirsutus]